MKILLTISLMLSSLLPFAQDSTSKEREVEYQKFKLFQSEKYLGKQFGQFTVKLADSKSFTNVDLKDKIVFINFWFESCPPCISELDGFNKLFDTLANNKDFLFISFTYDTDSVIQKMKRKYNIKFPVFHIEKLECYRLNFNSGFPASFIVDKTGFIRYFKLGGQTDREKSTKEIMTEIYPKIIEQL